MKYIKSLLIVLSILIFTGCDSILDLDPQQSIDTNLVLTTAENIELTLVGTYPIVRDAYGQNMFHFSELLADNGEFEFRGTFSQPRDLINKDLVDNFSWGNDAWNLAYDAINRTNIVLDYKDVLAESDRDEISGQAMFLRGLMYFDMVRFYAKPYVAGQANNQPGVPLMLHSNFDVSKVEYPERATVDAVYDQAISDLSMAKTLLGEDSFYANRFAAAAILSRIYLQKGMYEEAAIEANYVITEGGFDLTEVPFDAYNNETNGFEDVFTFQQNNDDNIGESNAGMATFYASTDATGRSDFQITNVETDKYEAGDLRGEIQTDLDEDSKINDVKSIYYLGFGSNSTGGNYCAKWLDFKTNLTFIRLAEMYLTRAEGNFEAGTTLGATPLDDINKIRYRAGLVLIGSVTQSIIRNERKLELAFEGFRLHDIKRWKESVGTLAYDDPSLVMPIPKREIDVNDKLTQNEGY
ncbi:RagB/SusD family nutrient uptake outer membrane protein [Labilibaculum antarcticum]|uniref:RagB/SusD family nutrient uptake outer membrane protein n=1 Tax=Labilibaculum antarcticum TaxID=1717717 RepID=A0A1Y1CKZ4_9BACT|nr:RagB/SusD family nutrient uptake outer membrane protein [Labilibaculum antarcticum]BAX80974.1 RagB/SusD family nutrient uptake outer membrane protein [Labilibaculum antarcticum]